MRRTCIGVVVGLAVSFGLPASGGAQDFETALRLGVSVDLASYRQETIEIPASRFTSESRTTTETSGYGFVVPRLGLDVGGFFARYIGIGVNGSVFALDQSTTTTGVSGETFANALQYRATGWVEGRIPLGSVVALQLRGELGITGGTRWTGETRSSSSTASATTTAFVGGGRFGLHVHAAPAFSISPYVAAYGVTGGGSVSASGSSTSTSVGVEGLEVTLGVQLLGWIELSPAARARDDGAHLATDIEPTGAPAREEGPRLATDVGAAPPVVPTVPTGVPTEPVLRDGEWYVELEMGDTVARVWAAPGSELVRIEVDSTSEDGRLTGCTEALVVGATSGTMTVTVSARRTFTQVIETALLAGTAAHLDLLRTAGSTIELCGFTLEPTARARYAAGRLRDRLRGP
jgi:hypothetical protein